MRHICHVYRRNGWPWNDIDQCHDFEPLRLSRGQGQTYIMCGMRISLTADHGVKKMDEILALVSPPTSLTCRYHFSTTMA